MEQIEQQLDIETLLAGSTGLGLGRQHEVFDVLSGKSPWHPQLQNDQPWKDFTALAQPELDRYLHVHKYMVIHACLHHHM